MLIEVFLPKQYLYKKKIVAEPTCQSKQIFLQQVHALYKH